MEYFPTIAMRSLGELTLKGSTILRHSSRSASSGPSLRFLSTILRNPCFASTSGAS